MGHKPQECEASEIIAVEDRGDIELEEGRTRQRIRVAQNAQDEAVGDYAPQRSFVGI